MVGSQGIFVPSDFASPSRYPSSTSRGAFFAELPPELRFMTSAASTCFAPNALVDRFDQDAVNAVEDLGVVEQELEQRRIVVVTVK